MFVGDHQIMINSVHNLTISNGVPWLSHIQTDNHLGGLYLSVRIIDAPSQAHPKHAQGKDAFPRTPKVFPKNLKRLWNQMTCILPSSHQILVRLLWPALIYSILFLVGCPPGEYFDVTYCQACPVNAYKSLTGSQPCTICPNSTTTGGRKGETNASSCKVPGLWGLIRCRTSSETDMQ